MVSAVQKAEQRPGPLTVEEPEPMFDLIELLFFAYRDFVADPDRILENIGFGRAHHRVLHFVDRQPGLTIAELLDILRITKQSLSRVLKELLDQNYVEQRAGVSDRRQRLLYPTNEGRRLARDLARLQTERLCALDQDADRSEPKQRIKRLPKRKRHGCGVLHAEVARTGDVRIVVSALASP
jgi:DNA-binding MarR family transcriptional regulator